MLSVSAARPAGATARGRFRLPGRSPATASRRPIPPAPQADNPFTVADAPPLVPQDQPETEAEPAPKFDPGVPDDVETIAARRVRQTYADRKDQRTLLRRLASLPMLIVVLLGDSSRRR